jgi:hypothetical protein
VSDYLKSTNFATKDTLPSGNTNKIVKGTELDNEFNAIASSSASKADTLNPVFSGLLTTDTAVTTGSVNIGGSLSVASDAQFSGTGRLLFPRGTTAQRPASPTSGSTRYNTDLGYLENYNGTAWIPVGYVTPADVSDKVNTSTGYFQVPVGTTLQRPVSPAEGLIRYNSVLDIYEGYINSDWQRFVTASQSSYAIAYLIISGGGGGGGNSGGGGGAGGYLSNTYTATPGTVFTVTVGAGGAAATNGSNSSITGIATGAGGGAGGSSQAGGSQAGGSGGSGGGGGGGYNNGNGGAGGGATQGNAGGGGASGSSGLYGGGGGGGATSAGGGGSGVNGGAGGAGTANAITGVAVTYAGGGGGGADYNTGVAGTGGAGGGAAGGPDATAGGNGTANTGGGAGGGGSNAGAGGSGGSGVVILSMPSIYYTGTVTGLPTVTTSGSNTIVKFTISGSYTS